MTHGGMGYAKEYQVERLFRESMLPRIAPVTRAADPVVHRRERARSAEVVLKRVCTTEEGHGPKLALPQSLSLALVAHLGDAPR